MKEESTFVTCSQMKEIEKKAAEEGLSYYQMMENAGLAAADFIKSKGNVQGKRILVFCGKGNNGGDGFVVARALSQAGAKIQVILAEGEPQTAEAITNLALCKKLGLPIIRIPEILTEFVSAEIWGEPPADIAVDAIYGTGFHGPLSQGIRGLVQSVNASKAKVYALDIPSGLAGDSGEADEDAIRADFTLVFHALKPVHLMKEAQDYLGQIELLDIGIRNNHRDEATSTTSFFQYRMQKAFAGVRGLRIYENPEECIDRLALLLQAPLCNAILEDPVWWFRGTRCLRIKGITRLSSTKCLIDRQELEIESIAAYLSDDYYRDFVYVKTKGETPTEEISSPEYALFEGIPITKEQYEEGFAEIDGKHIDFDNRAQMRLKRFAPYNFVICAKYHPFHSPAGNRLTQDGLDKLLLGEMSLDEFVQKSSQLRKIEMDY